MNFQHERWLTLIHSASNKIHQIPPESASHTNQSALCKRMCPPPYLLKEDPRNKNCIYLFIPIMTFILLLRVHKLLHSAVKFVGNLLFSISFCNACEVRLKMILIIIMIHCVTAFYWNHEFRWIKDKKNLLWKCNLGYIYTHYKHNQEIITVQMSLCPCDWSTSLNESVEN